MPRPTFFVLGPSKAGTTSLYDTLRRHSRVCMSDAKEPRFFELHYDRGIREYEEGCFRGYRGEPAVGEASPMYVFLPYVPARIFEHYPDARLIVVLRDPMERAHSNWWMHHTAGRESLDFVSALRDNLDRLGRGIRFDGRRGEYLWKRNVEAIEKEAVMLFRTYVDEGLYGECLSRYLGLFPRDQILLVPFRELWSDSARTLERVLRHVGLEPEGDLTMHHSNAAFSTRVARLIRMVSPLTRLGLVPRFIIDSGKRLLGGRRPATPRLPEDLREELTRIYQADTDQLVAHFSGLTIPSGWNEVLRPMSSTAPGA